MAKEEYKRDYDWALNKTKLLQSVAKLEENKKLDNSVEISESTIKEEYVKRAGLLADRTNVSNDPKVNEEEAPHSRPAGRTGRTADKKEE